LTSPVADLLPVVVHPAAEPPACRRCPRCGEGILSRIEMWPPSHGPVPLRCDSS
jgi:hypothetical protein